LKADIDTVISKSDKPRRFLLGRQSPVRCEAVDDIGQLLAHPLSISSRDTPENDANVLIRSTPSAFAKSFGEIDLLVRGLAD
jgi:hypothetical protein